VLGQPVVRFGDGSMVRDYVYVEDLVRMLAPVIGTPTRFDLYNVGSGIGCSVSEILDDLRVVTGVDFPIEERAVPTTFVDRVVLNTGRFRGEFGETTLTGLDEGIRRTFEGIKAEYGV
jgi:UDP-glucose 4-epimerase